MLPTSIIFQWLQGLLSLGIFGGGIYALWQWVERARDYDPDLGREVPAAQLSTLALARHMGNIEYHTHFAELVGEFAGADLGVEKKKREERKTLAA